jgi:hypothetical protein
MISQNITREHILKAIEEAERLGIPVDRSSDRYDLEYNQKHYPHILFDVAKCNSSNRAVMRISCIAYVIIKKRYKNGIVIF